VANLGLLQREPLLPNWDYDGSISCSQIRNIGCYKAPRAETAIAPLTSSLAMLI
jgi:hypothetical protein